jgi:hypothetical protein
MVTKRQTTPLGIRVSHETKAAIDQAAADDMRSTAGMVEKILVDWLRAHGYLPPLK